MLDIAIVGGGPAGLSAGIKAASEGLSAAVFEASDRFGGRCASSPLIENIPGFDRGISGPVYAETLHRQAQRFGCRFRTGSWVKSIEQTADDTIALTVKHKRRLHVVEARSALITLGLAERELENVDLPAGVLRYRCDPDALRSLRDKRVLFVGGGNSSAQLALEAAEWGASVDIVARQELDKNVSAYLLPRVRRMEELGRLRLLYGEVTSGWVTKNGRNAVSIKRKGYGADIYYYDVVFAFPGGVADVPFDNLALAPDGRILTGTDLVDFELADPPYAGEWPRTYETSVPGIFAAGDARFGNTGSVALAQGEGTQAVQTIYRAYLPQAALPGGVRPEARN